MKNRKSVYIHKPFREKATFTCSQKNTSTKNCPTHMITTHAISAPSQLRPRKGGTSPAAKGGTFQALKRGTFQALKAILQSPALKPKRQVLP